MKTAQIRAAFLKFFEDKGHTQVASSSLVPEDESLLFTNAGMVQFKPFFLNPTLAPYASAVSSQKCVRAGGKHNDLENVGFTARHHTFFEMLGNFSFGKYFKQEAIEFALEFVTKILQIPLEKLFITVFLDDDEAYDIWTKKFNIAPDNITRCGEKDNFWSMGETGPCGPCSEIFYDHGPEVAGGPPGSPEENGDRFIEIWNLVFMQYNKDASGKLTPLPKPCVDTGMGLERIAAIMQNKHNNFEIDIFANLIEAAATLFNITDTTHKSLRVIADHLRSCSFLIADGVIPSNEGRGYVLRRILRRAVRHGKILGAKQAFIYLLVPELVSQMQVQYPELADKQQLIKDSIFQEELQFHKTLEHGLALLDKALSELQGDILPGDVIFKLYDTYGFPVDLIADITKERNVSLNIAEFEQHMQKQRQRARAASSFSNTASTIIQSSSPTHFVGYEELEAASFVQELGADAGPLEVLEQNQEGYLILNSTPFYAQAGGQVGDTGIITSVNGKFLVTDTQKQQDVILHFGKVIYGKLALNEQVTAIVDNERRQAIRANHSATHLLHAALRQSLGLHVQQKGSIVESGRLRFDFAHNQPLTAQQLMAVEQLVNKKILDNSKVETKVMSIEEAQSYNAMALFSEKYADKVRVLFMGEDFSVELCGGTHVNYTCEIALFKIINETGVAAGVRRIEAVTGAQAYMHVNNIENLLQQVAVKLKAPTSNILTKLDAMLAKSKDLEKQNASLMQSLASNASDLTTQAEAISDFNFLATVVPATDIKALRSSLDSLKNKLSPAIVVLALVQNNKINLVAGISKELTPRFNAIELINIVAKEIGGKGGGRADMAQAGGSNLDKLEDGFAKLKEQLKNS